MHFLNRQKLKIGQYIDFYKSKTVSKITDIKKNMLGKKKVEVLEENFVVVDDSLYTFSGNLRESNVFEVIQLIEMASKDGFLRVSTGRRNGFVVISNGYVIDASFRRDVGLDAFVRIASLEDGDFHFEESVISRSSVINKSLLALAFICSESKIETDKAPHEIMETDKVLNKIIDAGNLSPKIVRVDNLSKDVIEIGDCLTLNFENILKNFREIKGFLAAGFYDGNGNAFSNTGKNNLNFEEVGHFAIELYSSAKSISNRMKCGICKFVEIRSNKYVFIHMCVTPKKIGLGVLLDADGNIGLLKHQMKKKVKSYL